MQRRTIPHVVASTVQLVLDAVLERQRRCHDNDDDDVISQSAAVHAVEVVARVCDVISDVTSDTAAAVCDVVQRFARDVVNHVVNNDQLASQVQSLQIMRTRIGPALRRGSYRAWQN